MVLIDYFINVIAYVIYFSRTVSEKQPPFEKISTDIRRMIDESQTKFQAALKKRINTTEEDYKLALYAICSWIDESLIYSDWNERDKWISSSLQLTYLNTQKAGVHFFDKMSELQGHQREVREVYYLCLAMGFKGRYFSDSEAPLLQNTKLNNLKSITGTTVGVPTLQGIDLFPEAYSEEITTPTKPGNEIFTPSILLGFSIPIVLYTFLYFTYRFILSTI